MLRYFLFLTLPFLTCNKQEVNWDLMHINIPVDAEKHTREAANDLKLYLNQVGLGNLPIQRTNSGTSGIILAYKRHAQLPAKLQTELKRAGNESFAIHQTGRDQLLLVGNSDAAMSHAAYFFLEQLGIRWYFPGDLWTHIPEKARLSEIESQVVSPDFDYRDFFGTGGFAQNPVDPQGFSEHAWETWKRRNRFGAPFWMPGHVGTGFNKSHKSILEKHPEYRPEIGGKRQPWEPNTKLCVSNPAAVDLYVDYIASQFQTWRSRKPSNQMDRIVVGAEPADGGKHCACTACKRMGSVSDRMFHVANQAAKRMEKQYPSQKVEVHMLAYNKHAAVPSIDIHPNVLVFVVPYAFQKVSRPEALVQQWAAKKSPIYIRDYWGIPDWQKDLPGFGWPKLKKRWEAWRPNNVSGIHVETSYSIGATGLTLYLGGKMAWNSNTNPQTMADEIYTHLFGRAKTPMARLLNSWQSGYDASRDLPTAYKLIQQADQLAEDPKVKKRILEWKKYLHYLNLTYQYELAKKSGNKTKRRAAAEDVIEYIWSIYHSNMVHTTRMHNLIINRFEGIKSDLRDDWSLKGKRYKKEQWRKVRAIEAPQAERLFQEKLRQIRK